MPKLACSIPRSVALACSGGSDSMAALSFLLKGKREVELLHFNHGTHGSDVAEAFVSRIAAERGLKLTVGKPKTDLKPTESAWREARYDFFSESKLPIVMAHHLNDAVEWWIFSSLRGCPTLMPIERKHEGVKILRPFMFFTRDELIKHNSLNNVEDPSNHDLRYCRNRIRSNVVPEALKINPGLFKTIQNLYRRVDV